MTEYMLGKREQVGWVEEDGGYGTLSSNTMSADGFIPGKNIRVTPNFSKNFQEILSAGADNREIEDYEEGPESLAFTISFNPTNWKFLKYCAHGTVTNTDSGSYYTHTFTKADEVKSFTMEWAKRSGTHHVITLTGCVVKSWTVRFSSGTEDSMAEVTCNCVAKSATTGTSVTTLSAPTEDAFQFRHAKLTWSGSEVTEVKSGEFTCSNGIDDNDSRYANASLDKSIGEPIPKVLRYNFRFNIHQKDDTYFDDWNAATAVGSTNKLELIRGSNDDLVITFSNTYVDNAVSPTNIEGITNVDVIGKCLSSSFVAKDSHDDY